MCYTLNSGPQGTHRLQIDKIMRQIANCSCTAQPSNPLVGQQVSFNASATYDLDNDVVSYKWDFKDGNTTTSNSVISHAFSAAGVYNVTLAVTDREELTTTFIQEISVKMYQACHQIEDH
jgi:PKD repeat protein